MRAIFMRFSWEKVFFSPFLLVFSNVQKSPSEKRSLSSYCLSLFIWEMERLFILLSFLNDDFSSHHYFLLMWRLLFVICRVVTSLGHWVDGWCHCSCKVFSFWHHAGWGRNPPTCVLLLPLNDLLSRWGTFAYRSEAVTRHLGHN